MSMMNTLAKMAIGMALAKGTGSMTGNPGAQSSGATALDGLFGAGNSPQAPTDSQGLENMLDQMLGGAQPGGSASQGRQTPTGGLGGLLEELSRGTGSGTGKTSRGGLDELLAGMSKGSETMGKTGARHTGKQTSKRRVPSKSTSSFGDDETAGGGFGDVFSSQFSSIKTKAKTPSPDQEVAAALMIRAMVQAAKADGKFDLAERRKLVENLGDISPDERRFVEAEMARDVDTDWLVAQVPHGLQAQIYTMSVLGIVLDENSEAQYLHKLAQGLGLDPGQVNNIHNRLGVPAIYR